MARKDKTITFGKCAVRIRYLPPTREYRVTEVIEGRVTGGKVDGGYFTDDARDARSTAAHMVKRLKRHSSCKR